MMKKITIFTLTMILGFASFAQNYYHLESVGSKAPFSNLVPSGTPFTFLLQATAGTTVNDQLSSAFQMPFPFTFYGETYNSYKVSDNGYLSFDVSQTTSQAVNVSLPDADAPKAAIFAFWDDLRITAGTSGGSFGVFQMTLGAAPNRIHIVKWFQLMPAGLTSGTKYVFFAIALKEQGGFDVVLEGTGGTANFTESATIGSQNADGTVGYTAKGPNYAFPMGGVLAEQNDDLVFKFVEGVANTFDVGVTAIDLIPALGLNNAPFQIKGTVQNYSSTDVTSLDISYKINGGSPVTSTINLNIPKGSFASFTHPTAWNPTSTGTYSIEVAASMPNGNTDEDETNNASTKSVDVFDQLFQRKPLYEVFTSSTCGPCRPGNVVFHNVIDNNSFSDEATYIKWQQNFPGTGDPYATAEAVSRRNYYGINSIPRMEIDGGWDKNASSFSTAVHEESKALPSLVKINTTFNKWAKSVEAQVDVESITDIPGTHLLHVIIFETITYKNVKSNGEIQFEHVFKKYMTLPTGENIGALKKGNSFSKKYNFDFKGDYILPANGQPSSYPNLSIQHTVEDFKNLRVLAWVQNSSTKEVLQSEYATEVKVGIEKLSANFVAEVYPNPASNVAFISLGLTNPTNVTLTVMNASGQVIDFLPVGNIPSGDQTFQLDTKTYANGVYFVTISTTEGVVTKKLIINN